MANRWILLDRSVSISKRLKYFNAVVSSVACFGSGHRATYNSQLATLDVHFRKLCRSIVGPPSDVDWNAAWHEILHLWNERTRNFVANARVNSAGQCTRSKAFDKSRLTIQIGTSALESLSKTKRVVTKCSSTRLPPRKPCCSSGWWPFRTHDLDDPKFISRPTGASCWQQWLQQVFCHTRWSTTRMRFKPPAFLFSVGSVNGELA